jgi:hypothetical protein
MKNLFLSCLIVLFIMVQLSFAGDEGKIYGKGISLETTTKISEILIKPDENVGKTFLVEGRIVDVCKKRGCWMELASDQEFQTIRVKVKDGEVIFPLSAKGKLAKVEGVLEKIELTKEQTMMWKKHEAEEQGEEFDSTCVKEGMNIYRLKGIGAVIQE